MDAEHWLTAVVAVQFGPWVAYDSVAAAFFTGVFDARGPVTGQVLADLVAAHQLDLARQACAAVAADLAATGAGRIRLEPTAGADGGVRVRIRDTDTSVLIESPRLRGFDGFGVLIEVADAVQDMLMTALTVWPTCPRHRGVGLWPEPATPAPAWICRTGPHPVAGIGALRARPGPQLNQADG